MAKAKSLPAPARGFVTLTSNFRPLAANHRGFASNSSFLSCFFSPPTSLFARTSLGDFRVRAAVTPSWRARVRTVRARRNTERTACVRRRSHVLFKVGREHLSSALAPLASRLVRFSRSSRRDSRTSASLRLRRGDRRVRQPDRHGRHRSGQGRALGATERSRRSPARRGKASYLRWNGYVYKGVVSAAANFGALNERRRKTVSCPKVRQSGRFQR